jgi:hypothetical protein
VKATARRQRGIALLLVMAVIAMGGTWYMVSRLNRLSLNHSAADRIYNAEVLSKAKQALIGYVVAQANKPGENNPGALPCPEAPGSFNDASGNDGKVNSAGCSLPAVGRYPWRTLGTDKFVDAAGEPLWYVVSPGWAITGVGANTVINSNSVGQLNLDGVAYTTQAAGDTVVALLIAPGPAIYTTCNGTGVSQVRSPTANVAPDWKNYLECENATNPADSNFVTTGPSASFNDQVVKITLADIMPGIEAAVADRIQREIDPVLKTVYGWSSALAGAAWGHTTLGASITSSATALTVASASGLPAPNFRLLVDNELMLVTAVSGTTLTVTRGYETSAATTHSSGAAVMFGGSSAIYPYAATFSNPSTNAMQGSAGTYAGLLPLNYAETSPGSGTLCTAGASAPRCSPNFVAWHATGTTVSSASGTATLGAWTCTTSVGGSQFSCSIPYSRFCSGSFNQACSSSLSVNIAATVDNLGMAMREVVTDLTTRVSSTLSSPSMQVTLGNGGTAAITLTGSLPTTSCQTTNFSFFFGWYCNTSNTVTVTAPITVFADHPLTNSSDSNYGWFTRNKWHEVAYYAIASGYSPAILPSQPACTTGASCLSVSNVTPSGGQRAILILAGRSINGSTRPSSTLADYLEFGNATGSYEKQTVSRANAPALKKPFNDRIVAVDSN